MMRLLESELFQQDLSGVTALALPWEKLQGASFMISGATGMIGSTLIHVLMKKNREDASEEVARMRELGDRIDVLNGEIRELEEKIRYILDRLPNLPAEGVAAGGKENNTVDHQWGKKPEFDFEPKDHVELCKSLGLIE